MELHACFLFNHAEDTRSKEKRTCEQAKQVSKQINIIIIIIKDWTSLIRSVSRVTTFLANVSSVFRLFPFLVVCSDMI